MGIHAVTTESGNRRRKLARPGGPGVRAYGNTFGVPGLVALQVRVKRQLRGDTSTSSWPVKPVATKRPARRCAKVLPLVSGPKVAVDVNSGRYTGKKDPEKTILKTNLEAAREVARQARLRDLGGILVCDFIDMETKANRDRVIQELRQHLSRDRARTKAFAVSELGLVEMTRQRVRQSHLQNMTEACPTCHGTGRVFTGDRSGDFLFAALHRAGFANQATSVAGTDGLRLRDAYVAALVRCAPPANKPTRGEALRCRSYLAREMRVLPRLGAILALGKIAMDGVLGLLRDEGRVPPRKGFAFGHGQRHDLGDGLVLFVSYHPSQQNTFTGKLTPRKMDAVLASVNRHLRRTS